MHPHPREKGVGPLVFIFGKDFLLFFLRYSVEFQDFPRIFAFGEEKNQREEIIAFYDTEPPPSPNLSREG